MARPVYLRLNPYRIFLLAATVLIILALIDAARQKLPDFVMPAFDLNSSAAARYSSTFICHPCAGPMVHIVEAVNGDLLSAWFGGSREGAGDVRIFESRLIPGGKNWTHETVLIERQNTSADLHRYIKKLGNPVLGRGQDGRLWLFYVTVSAGGWSGSSINYRISADNGKTWAASRRLITSPFFNVSTLVHGVPLARSDGTLTVPVYHELLGKFSELLRVDKNGKILSKRRISHGRQSFQPAITAMTTREAVLLARSASKTNRYIFISSTQDAGKTWSTPVPTNLPNPDAGIAVASGTDNSLLAVYNDSQTDRGNLALAISHDLGKTWKRIYYFEHEKVPHSGEEYSYPTIIRSGNQYHLVYTWRRKGIRYVSFNSTWVKQQEERK
jgi:predicted neuraminidase